FSPVFHEVSPSRVPAHSFCQTRLPMTSSSRGVSAEATLAVSTKTRAALSRRMNNNMAAAHGAVVKRSSKKRMRDNGGSMKNMTLGYAETPQKPPQRPPLHLSFSRLPPFLPDALVEPSLSEQGEIDPRCPQNRAHLPPTRPPIKGLTHPPWPWAQPRQEA